MVTKKISMTIEEEIFNNFKKYCKDNGMKISTRVELLMKKDINTNIVRH